MLKILVKSGRSFLDTTFYHNTVNVFSTIYSRKRRIVCATFGKLDKLCLHNILSVQMVKGSAQKSEDISENGWGIDSLHVYRTLC